MLVSNPTRVLRSAEVVLEVIGVEASRGLVTDMEHTPSNERPTLASILLKTLTWVSLPALVTGTLAITFLRLFKAASWVLLLKAVLPVIPRVTLKST